LTAGAIAALDHVVPRRLEDLLGIAAAAASTALSLVIMVQSQSGTLIHWFGGWKPDGEVAIGISFTADPLGAGMAALASGLVLLSLVYSFTYMREAARLFDVLVLVFCGGMCGFALTSDLFNMFVWFELTGVAAYALAGFKVAELGPVQGAVNFAISNTFGAYFIVLGLGLLYAKTGALNLAQLGHALAGSGPHGLVIVALTLIVVGFLVHGAVVPFHFWLADANAVAPAPACVLFSGVLIEVGLLGLARVYWTVFAGPFASHQVDVKSLLVWVGLATVLVGAVMAFLQRHLKRMLAYATISHAGATLVGFALLDSKALAGTALVVLAHGLLKGGLFFVCGLILLQLREIDELRLHGKGRQIPWSGVLWAAGSVGLIGVPYVGTSLGHSLIDDGATIGGIAWAQPLLMIGAGLSAAAMLRAGARVFLGWGANDDPLLTAEPPEHPAEREASQPLMGAVAAVAIVLGLAVSVVPGLEARAEHGADRFRDRAAYARLVLEGKPQKPTPRLPYTVERATAKSWGYGLGALALAVGGAAFGLWRRRLPAALRRPARIVLRPPVLALHSVHSGIVTDYLFWIVLGTAVIGGIWGITLR
jgi:multicomponent Na+:H+ antiporter subunit D